MERESFEDKDVGQKLNDHFISIKVDREERPDIDHIYMSFCQMLTGHGGWPLTIIMTPEQKPFFAGTYFPKKSRAGMTGLMDILDRVIDAWNNNRDVLMDSGEQFTQSIDSEISNIEEKESVSREVLHNGFRELEKSFEPKYGGFSQAPKFPTPHNLYFLLRYWKVTGEKKALDMVEKTLEGMYRGGIFDHIGFGFSRYSTDKKWLVPHFEKMLYDNALLAIAYTEAYQATKNKLYAAVAQRIFTYVLRDMTSPEGGFYSAEDADSEGEEGEFYVWTVDEVKEVLGVEDGQRFCDYYGIIPQGNFEGRSIPNRLDTSIPVNQGEEYIDPLRKRIFEYREKRIHPFKDDKILTSWNGLMIAAMALGGRVFGKKEYTEAAQRAVSFINEKLVRKDGRLLARYRDGEAALPAYLDDYAFLVWGLIELYQATYNTSYLDQAVDMNRAMIKYFLDEQNGGFYLYGKDSEQLISRPKEIYDGATPSGNSVAASNMFRLARLTGDQDLERLANDQIETFGAQIKRVPHAYTHFLTAIVFATYPGQEVVIAGERANEKTLEMLKTLNSAFFPNVVSLLKSNDEEGRKLTERIPFIKEQKPIDGVTTAYICQNFACRSPVTDLNEFESIISSQ